MTTFALIDFRANILRNNQIRSLNTQIPQTRYISPVQWTMQLAPKYDEHPRNHPQSASDKLIYGSNKKQPVRVTTISVSHSLEKVDLWTLMAGIYRLRGTSIYGTLKITNS